MVSETFQDWKTPVADEKGRHAGEEGGVAQDGAHADFPAKSPVGLMSSTTTRIMNDTANL